MESNEERKEEPKTREVIGSELPGLTDRQWWLHDFLERMAMFYPSKWWTQSEIIEECKRLPCDGGYSKYEDDGYKRRASLKSHEVCAAITTDAEVINRSDKVDTIIMLVDARYKMPNTVEEGENYLEETILKRSARGMASYWSKLRKLHKDGQYKLFANSGRLMPEGDEQAAERFITSVVHVLDEKDKKKKGDDKNGTTKNVQPKSN